MMQPSLVDQLKTERTLNVSPKVAAPAFVGLASTTIVCILRHYGVIVDTGSVAGAIVLLMTAIGWLMPHASPPAKGAE